MKHVTLALTLALTPSALLADISAQETQYTKDRNQAIEQFTPELGASCVEDFAQKKKQAIKPSGVAAFNDLISREVYTTVFWNHSDRGVAFTLPVQASDDKGQRAGDIACLYSVKDKQLHFELSQQLF